MQIGCPHVPVSSLDPGNALEGLKTEGMRGGRKGNNSVRGRTCSVPTISCSYPPDSVRGSLIGEWE